MDCSKPGLPVYHWLLGFTQIRVHWVSDAIQPSHSLMSHSPPSFNLSQHQGLFKWVSSSHQGGQSIGVSASASVLPMNIQDWFPSGWTGWISLQSKGLYKSLLQHHSSKASIFWRSAFFTVQLSHPHMTTEKTEALTRRIFIVKAMSLLFNMMSRFVITFLPRSKQQVGLHICILSTQTAEIMASFSWIIWLKHLFSDEERIGENKGLAQSWLICYLKKTQVTYLE